jgi:hypothetical protein
MPAMRKIGIGRLIRAARRPAVIVAVAFAGLIPARVALLHAQRSSGYGGSGPGWWTADMDSILPRQDDYDNATGRVRMVIPTGIVRSKGHPFFQALGSNGRACVTCHQPSNGMSVSATELQTRWTESDGKDAVFAAVDGSNCPDLPQNLKSSHSLLLDHGLFRIALPWPPHDPDGKAIAPEFRIEVVSDPTGCNNSAIYGLHSSQPAVSVFRRPRITANLRYIAPGSNGLMLMADGRVSTLHAQAIDAAKTHEQAGAPDEEQLRQIVEFESRLYIAQGSDIAGGLLNEDDGPLALGPENLADGKMPRIGGTPDGRAANPLWLSFDRWRTPAVAGDVGLQLEFRASVARGSDVFFGHRFQVQAGSAQMATCASCHSPGMPRWMDIGTSNVSDVKQSSDLPLFRISCDTQSTPREYHGRVLYTHDPGRALISGKCADTGAFVMQQFHALPARAPYFANGSAASLTEVVDFYERRFRVGLTSREKQDLINFLRVL